MRFSCSALVITLLALSWGAVAGAQTNAPLAFSRNLSIGSSGPDVAALQKVLNQDPATRIASSGPGSPGNETDYFGPLTAAAVSRFQEEYASAILVPAGLTAGNGYFGAYTRAKLSALAAAPPGAAPAPATLPAPAAATTTAVQNPNLKNVGDFFAALDQVAAKQNIATATLATLKEQALARLATTTDLRAAFLKTVQDSSHQAAADNSLSGRVVAIITRAFDAVFMPNYAHAATGVPFGGALLFAMPCDGGVWNITLKPMPPFYPALIAYETGSQAFLSYNIPASTWLLGEYEPAPMAYCWIGIYPYPSEGLITPMVGSSLL